MSYTMDIIDGREVPPTVITTDHVMVGRRQGSVHVEAGVFELRGRNEGSLHLRADCAPTISGTNAGSVHVDAGVALVVTGAIEGVHVERGGAVLIEAGGKLAGSIHNAGRIVIRGVFGGSRSGSGELVFEGSGHEMQPIIRNGTYVYMW